MTESDAATTRPPKAQQFMVVECETIEDFETETDTWAAEGWELVTFTTPVPSDRTMKKGGPGYLLVALMRFHGEYEGSHED